MTRRRICFVTGTRAEFGLMNTVLWAIQSHPKLQLQLVVTGMHLQPKHGRSIDAIRRQGWKIDGIVPWKSGVKLAAQTGKAMSELSGQFDRLKSDIVLVVGDRVEAFAAASAGHVSHRIVAHVHGGDRAAGQIDDSLRHAISKLSHVHFPATAESARRLIKLGEDRFRVHQFGSPGIESIVADASKAQALVADRFALLVLHPADRSAQVEYQRARLVLNALREAQVEKIVAIYPNNDPGAAGIIRCWDQNRRQFARLWADVARADFLALMRDATVMVGNSSSGIIEAASFGTRVVDIGPRQQGRDCSSNVVHVSYNASQVRRAVQRIWRLPRGSRWRGRNVYDGRSTGQRIADVLASLRLDERLYRKLIAY